MFGIHDTSHAIQVLIISGILVYLCRKAWETFKEIRRDVLMFIEYKKFCQLQQEAEQESIEAMRQRLYDGKANVRYLADYRMGRMA